MWVKEGQTDADLSSEGLSTKYSYQYACVVSSSLGTLRSIDKEAALDIQYIHSSHFKQWLPRPNVSRRCNLSVSVFPLAKLQLDSTWQRTSVSAFDVYLIWLLFKFPTLSDQGLRKQRHYLARAVSTVWDKTSTPICKAAVCTNSEDGKCNVLYPQTEY